MFPSFFLLVALIACNTYAIQVKPSYGHPQQRVLHREYGVPQQIPFREYGPPVSKYGPPKLNNIGDSGSFSGLHEQIKTYYGAPKPFYGPPYETPQKNGFPSQQYGPPPKPGGTFGPPQLKLQKPALSYGPSLLPQLPLSHPAPDYIHGHQPASSYGPPPSGPLNIPPKQIFGPPRPSYGPPPLPSFNQKPETTILLSAGHNIPSQNQQQQQVQIQIDATGHTHSVTGSQAPFHTACDGWKPILSPTGTYVENNHIETQTGYSQISQAQALKSGEAIAGITSGFGATAPSSTILAGGSNTGGNSIIDSLSDEQLVAVALQSNTFDASSSAQQYDILPPIGSDGNFNKHNINSLEAEALQLSLGSTDASYSKPPADSFGPSSKYLYKHESSLQSSSQGKFGGRGPGGSRFVSPSPSYPKYGPPKGNYGSPHAGNYGAPPPPKGNYGPPTLHNSNYGPPPPPTDSYTPPPFSRPDSPTLADVIIHYGKQSGNLRQLPPYSGVQPSKPVAYRPPVPTGLFETIGATVQHLDKFGVKPQLQVSTYIPPAANEIPHTSSGNLNIDNGFPNQQKHQEIPQHIVNQQLPQPRPPQLFVQIKQQPNAQGQYGVPPIPPLLQQGPPQSQYLPPLPLAQLQQQQLPHIGHQQQNFNQGDFYIQSAANSLDNTAFASNHFNHETVHIQALPRQHEQPHFHDCGHGPNFVGGNGLNYQPQQDYLSSGSFIAQNIPVNEQHIQLISGRPSSYGPPPSGGNDLDHTSYASEKSEVTVLPDATKTEELPALDGLNVVSAQKSQAIYFGSQETKNDETYQTQFAANNDQQQTANHEEILSAGLLETILNAVEQPQLQHQPLPANHKAENRSDIDINEEFVEREDENEPGVAVQESKNTEPTAQSTIEKSLETDAEETKPIVVKQENEAKH